jgi:hypothetical protein
LKKRIQVVEIGKINKLRVVKELDFGVYLDGGQSGEILMPRRYVPADCKPDDEVEVFIYLDSEDRLIATTEKPFAMVGDFALLEVTSVNSVGAFMDWGLLKDLLVPYREQSQPMQRDKTYMVYDSISNRIVASSKIDKFLDNMPPNYEVGQEVDLIIANQTELGYKAIINKLHTGIIYKNEVFQTLKRGQKLKGYIKKVREDEKIDLSLLKPHYRKVDDVSEIILNKLKENGGFIDVTDKSPAESIYDMFGVSKKAYKMAVGNLYKAKRIILELKGIRLVKN